MNLLPASRRHCPVWTAPVGATRSGQDSAAALRRPVPGIHARFMQSTQDSVVTTMSVGRVSVTVPSDTRMCAW